MPAMSGRAVSLPIVLLAAAAAVGAACGRPGTERRAVPPTHLLLVTLDTLRADRLGAYGYPRPTSPHLDRFAASAFVFEDATCSMPTTLPSHLSIVTGLRPAQHGVFRNGVVPSRNLESIFDLLAAQRGAATAAVVAAGVLDERYLSGLGLAEVRFPARRRQFQVPARVVTTTALEWLERHLERPPSERSPFALWVHYYDPHEPYTPPARFRERFARDDDPSLPNAMSTEALVALNRSPEPPTEGVRRRVSDLYDAEVALLDHHLGRLFAGLERLGVADDTVVAVVGDHGQALGEEGFYGHGLRLLEPVVKVPMLLRLPGQGGGGRIRGTVETIDLMPTLEELFDLRGSAELPGRSLMPALRAEGDAGRRTRLIERRSYAEDPAALGVALHAGDWKAIYYRDLDGTERRFLGEAASGLDGVDRYRDSDPRARLLAAAVEAARREADREPAVLDDEQRRMLRALGYLD